MRYLEYKGIPKWNNLYNTVCLTRVAVYDIIDMLFE